MSKVDEESEENKRHSSKIINQDIDNSEFADYFEQLDDVRSLAGKSDLPDVKEIAKDDQIQVFSVKPNKLRSDKIFSFLPSQIKGMTKNTNDIFWNPFSLEFEEPKPIIDDGCTPGFMSKAPHGQIFQYKK